MRVAIFVDAGYLYAEGSKSLSTSSGAPLPRASVALDLPAAIAQLRAIAAATAPDSPLLRIYWYDGVLRGDLSEEQRQLATMRDVKFRAGIVNRAGQQKGVDSLIVTDLIELARNKAIADAVLLSGDGDLRIAVQIAQSFGVRVHLVSIEPGPGYPSRSPDLFQEADTTTDWLRSDLSKVLTLKHGANANTGTAGTAATDEIPAKVRALLENAVDEFIASLGSIPIADFAAITPNRIPPEYDRGLLTRCDAGIARRLTRAEMTYVRNLFRERAGAIASPGQPASAVSDSFSQQG